MKIKKIEITNYRGVKNKQVIPFKKLTSIVGKNDAGKSIVLNAIATFLDAKNYPIVISDFNDSSKPIIFRVKFSHDNLKEIIESKIKSKIKKADGLEEFLNDFIFDDEIIYEREVSKIGKAYSKESILIKDFVGDEFSKLYAKSDTDLNKIIQDNNIEIPVEGLGRNSKIEKIKHIKEFCVTQEIEIEKKFIIDEFKIGSLFPQVELFVSDYGLDADTKFRTNSVSEISDYFNRETKEETQRLRVIEQEIEDEMQTEAESIKNFMSDYTSSLQKVEIKPQIKWSDAIKNVDVRFQFDGDENPISMSHKGTGYRRLFMVARFRYLAEKNKGNNILYLIEEPETFLHPSAQEDLLNALKELSEDNQIVITTHSPVFAGATNTESIILCKKSGQTIYEHSTEATKENFIFKIIDELGIKPSFNLRDYHEKIVFVESNNDAKFYNILCEKLLDNNLLNNDKILVLPFGGGEDIESFLNIHYFESSNRKLYLLIDSDKHQNNQEKQKKRAENFNKEERKKSYILTKSYIESYYHPRAIERVYNLPENTFNYFNDNENIRTTIKQIVKDKELGNKNIKEKNNFKVFNETSIDEFKELVEDDLIDFLKVIVS
ncbi:ATP-binding protein [Tenacibaculum dicentrarchi]|nr:ATP-binding protein [Tenacibaculum dicentrarchi]